MLMKLNVFIRVKASRRQVLREIRLRVGTLMWRRQQNYMIMGFGIFGMLWRVSVRLKPRGLVLSSALHYNLQLRSVKTSASSAVDHRGRGLHSNDD
jgi:hypothetical protein